MPRCLSVWVVPLTIGVALLGPVRADDPPANLPDRALYRLGDHRLHHRSSINSLVFSPDGRYLAASGTNQERGVRLWDAETGEQVAYLVADGPEWGWVQAVAFSPDGTRLLAGDIKGRVVNWDLQRRTGLKEFQSDGSRGITAVAFSPDGAILATGDADGAVTVRLARDPEKMLWVHGGRPRAAGGAIDGGGNGVVALQFTPTGNELVAALGNQAAMLVFQPDTGVVLRTLEPLHGVGSSTSGNVPLNSMSITADGRWIVTSGSRYMPGDKVPENVADGSSHIPVAEVRVCELMSGKLIHDLMGDRIVKSFGYSALAPDGKSLAIAHFSRIDLVSTESGELLRSLPLPGWWGSRPAFSGDGTRLAAAVGQTISIWDVASGTRLVADRPAHGDTVNAVDYSPDGERIATADNNGQLHVWHAATGVHAWDASLGDGASIRDMRFSGDGRLLAACGLRNWHTGRPQSMVNLWNSDGRLLETMHPGQTACGVVVSPDRTRLAAAFTGGGIGGVRVDLWQIDPLRKLAQFPRDENKGLSRYNAMTFSPDGRFVLTAEYNGTVARWDTSPAAEDSSFVAEWRPQVRRAPNRDPSSDPPDPWVGRDPWIGEAAFSSDGSLLVTSTNENLYLWDVAAGSLKETINIPEAPHGFRIALSPDSRLLAASEVLYAGAPGSKVIRIIDVATRQVVLTLSPVDARAMSLAFSPDNQRLITGFDNGTAMVWDVSR